MEWQEVGWRQLAWLYILTEHRIFENQHLLDATEIFRKLNVHKKVSLAALDGAVYMCVGAC